MVGTILIFRERLVPSILYHTHENALMGSLVRVFCTAETDQPSIDRALAGEPDFQVFFPVRAAIRQKILAVVESRPPEGRWARFPTFKIEPVRLPGHPHDDFWLWDGVREWRHEGRNDAIAGYPEREIINDTMLISRIEKRWAERPDRLWRD